MQKIVQKVHIPADTKMILPLSFLFQLTFHSGHLQFRTSFGNIILRRYLNGRADTKLQMQIGIDIDAEKVFVKYYKSQKKV